jgi:hypothetical protein
MRARGFTRNARLVNGMIVTATVAVAVAVGGRQGSLESALPGEWAALFISLAVFTVVGAATLVVTCLGHERMARRRARARNRARADVAWRRGVDEKELWRPAGAGLVTGTGDSAAGGRTEGDRHSLSA